MVARQRSFLVIVMALLIWLIATYSEVVLMIIATSFVASGLVLHIVRAARHNLASRPPKT